MLNWLFKNNVDRETNKIDSTNINESLKTSSIQISNFRQFVDYFY